LDGIGGGAVGAADAASGARGVCRRRRRRRRGRFGVGVCGRGRGAAVCAPHWRVQAEQDAGHWFVWQGQAGAARVLARAAPAGDGDHRLFVFSTEALVEDDGAGGGGGDGDVGGGGGCGAEAHAGFRVTAAGRCAHARAYVESVAARHGLAVCASRRIVLRQNAGRDVLGDIFAAGLAAEGRRGGLKSE